MPKTVRFNPERVAYFEKAGWEAYYARAWLRCLWLLIQLNREMFRMSWWVAIQAALDTVRASMAFAPADNDVPKATAHLAAFYAKARHSVGLKPDAETLAVLEMDYWVVHRQLAITRQKEPTIDNSEPMVQSLTRLHAAIFDQPSELMRPSAQLRTQAAVAVDRITGNYSTDVAADWCEVELKLQQAYRAAQGGRDEGVKG
jgi:hypothetical protein